MFINTKKYIILLFFSFLASIAYSQPFDLIIPQGDNIDSLTKELKSMQEVQRDIALEKLTREPTKLDAYIELGELRSAQGRLYEAKRFLEMALELDPKNLRANHDLVMVNYQLGNFDESKRRMDLIHRYHPLSDYEREKLESYQSRVNTEGLAGIYIREDSRNFREIMSVLEATFPIEKYPKTDVKYRAEMWTHEDNNKESINSTVYSTTITYTADNNNKFAFTYSPESIRSGDVASGYSLQGLMGRDTMKLGLRASKNLFKDNLYTIKNKLTEESRAITIYGDLHKRTRIMQGVTLADISDKNSRRRYDSSIIYSIFRNHIPFITTNLSIWDASYEKQFDKRGDLLNYWAPSDFQGGELSFTWEKTRGVHWWFGLEGNYVVNRYKFGSNNIVEEKGPGATLYTNYKFAEGSIFLTLSHRERYYFTERRLEIYGSLHF